MATSTPTPSATTRAREEYAPTGWATFAAIMLLIGGFFTAMWGLAAILNDQVVSVGGRGVIIADFTTWGWINLAVGVLMGLTGAGLLSGQNWARWAAIFFATVSAMIQIGSFTAFPLFSLAVIALDVVVIYQLTVNFREAPAR